MKHNAKKNPNLLTHILINFGKKNYSYYGLGYKWLFRTEKTDNGYKFAFRSYEHPRTNIFTATNWDDLMSQIEKADIALYNSIIMPL